MGYGASVRILLTHVAMRRKRDREWWGTGWRRSRTRGTERIDTRVGMGTGWERAGIGRGKGTGTRRGTATAKGRKEKRTTRDGKRLVLMGNEERRQEGVKRRDEGTASLMGNIRRWGSTATGE